MNVDIYIKERNGSREIRIPWLPEKITVKSGGASVASYDVMNKGEVAVPTGTGLTSISWASEFPGKNRTDHAMMRGTWKKPSYYHNILEDWRNKGTQLYIMVTGYPINMDVFLYDYNSTPGGGFGDLGYELEFREDRDLVVGNTKSSTTSGTTTSTSKTRRSTTTPTTYTIKQGDTLWTIAEKLLGSGAKWETLYNANEEIIQSTAKERWQSAGVNRDSENGHWIFPGTIISIPQ